MAALPAPEAAAVEHWRCIADFLLTASEWRKPGGLNVRVGFPADGREQKAQMRFLLERFATIDGLREALCAARDLPEPHYEARQWRTLRHIFMILRRAVGELRVLFAERDTVDFTELSIAAQEVLSSASAGPDVLLALSGNIRHLLVDEFQDTSRSQHTLLSLLIRAWEPGDGRTCFLVGDPMQSVYLFRQAEVEIFGHVANHGLVSEEHTVAFESVDLLTNFRSHEGLTTRWNEMFDAVFSGADERVGQVAYSHTTAAEPALPGEAVHVYPQIIGDHDGKVAPEERELALIREAEQVLAVVAEHQERIERAIAQGNEYRVAVLARSRPHLAKIVALLRERGVPFRAVELEKLSERQELIDLLSLIRALLHPMDRVAWFSALRAPWCGLTLRDLHILSGADDPAFQRMSVLELIERRTPFLSEDGAARLRRTAEVMKQALAVRFEGLHGASFSQWIERTWRSLGGAKCVDAAGYENVQVFFAMLDTVAPDGMACLTKEFELEMERLYAQPDPRVSERAGVQLMTIHKAKGLGFDVVIVPGLDRKAAADRSSLICSLERMNPVTDETEMLVAPIGYRGIEKHPTYKWVQKQRNLRADEELKRLMYVACTRARRSLHLLGTATRTKAGLRAGDPKSLLQTAWPALREDFERMLDARDADRTNRLVPFPAQRDKGFGLEIAAGGDPLAGAGSHPKLMLRRLPLKVDPRTRLGNVKFTAVDVAQGEIRAVRPEGSREARQKGSVVHALLEQSSRGLSLEQLRSSARALLRGYAYTGRALEDAVDEVLNAVGNCLKDSCGAWILAAHLSAQSEVSWTGWNNGALETLRADRVFVAGDAPGAAGETHLWIVDYKMSAPSGNEDFLTHQRAMYAPQLARYARALREAQGIDLPVRFALYYPRTARLDWWAGEES
jgi:ATP-dependent exoDNAse (exonuclease V) beta subunit